MADFFQRFATELGVALLVAIAVAIWAWARRKARSLLESTMLRILNEMKPNGGNSMRDRLDEVERINNGQTEILKKIDARLDRSEKDRLKQHAENQQRMTAHEESDRAAFLTFGDQLKSIGQLMEK